MPPENIGRYRILRELGHGAMGTVYEAEDPNIGRTVALKVVRTDQIGANREEVLRRFKNEARAAGKLTHPNIITIHDAGEHEGLLFIAMECVQGATLGDLIAKQGRLPAAQVVEIIRQVCLGLDFAHARGIIHRDVKPANILLSDSVVKITDFGIANVGDGMTITGTVVGTPNYMSPEQVLGKPLDGRSDLFGVGVMLYEMVTGERPFEGQSITTIMYKIVHEEPIAPRKLDASIHPGLSAIVERALAKSPEARFQTGAELAAALENYRQPGTATATLTGDEPTAELPVLPETATLTMAPTTVGAAAPVGPGYQTTAQAPTLQMPVEKKKRGFSPVLLGCFGLIAIGIIAITIITVVATLAPKHPKTPAGASGASSEGEGQAAAPTAPQPPNPAAVIERSPAKANKTTATLRLDSTPPGADVLVDGKRVNKSTPASISIDRGQHSISLRMPGFQTASAKFKVSGGEDFEFAPELVPVIPNVSVPGIAVPGIPDLSKLMDLQRTAGLSEAQRDEIKMWSQWGARQKAGQLSIMINSHPAGATILIDGKDTGEKSPAVVSATAGDHTVRIELAGYEPFEQKVTVAANRPTMLNPRLAPATTPQP